MKKALVFLVVVLLVLGGLGAYAMRSFVRAKAAGQNQNQGTTVRRGDIEVKVIETGTIDAVKSVEVKSRVSGRVARLLVDEGDRVGAGQLIAVIDPQETELRVRQDRAQLKGALSGVARQRIEMEQRRVTAAAAYRQALARVAQLEAEARAQPILTRASIEQAETALNTALQERDRLERSAHPNARVAAEAALREARANRENAQRELQRQRELVEKGFVAQRSLEGAQLQVELADARLDSAQEALNRLDSEFAAQRAKADEAVRQARAELARARAGSVQDHIKAKELESARAAVLQARAALADVKVMEQALRQSQAGAEQIQSVLSDSERQLRETEIRSPLSGIVTKRLIQEGELVASLTSFSSGTPIVRVEDQGTMRVRLNVNEIDVAKLRRGLPAVIEVDAIPGVKFQGFVQRIAPASNAGQPGQADAVVRYLVEVYLNEPDPRLRSGMSAKCTLTPIRKKNVLQLPLEYIAREGEKRFVEIAPPAGAPPGTKPQRRTVALGVQTGSAAEIVSGVREGERVVRPQYSGPPRRGAFSPDSEEGE